MSERFGDIKLTELDDEASGPSGQGDLMRLVLKLSEPAPYEWCEIFNQAWPQHFYMMNRSAYASGDHIEIICMPDELQNDQIPELKKVIEATNAAYGEYLAKQEQLAAEEADAEQKRKDDLSKLKKNLKFD